MAAWVRGNWLSHVGGAGALNCLGLLSSGARVSDVEARNGGGTVAVEYYYWERASFDVLEKLDYEDPAVVGSENHAGEVWRDVEWLVCDLLVRVEKWMLVTAKVVFADILIEIQQAILVFIRIGKLSIYINIVHMNWQYPILHWPKYDFRLGIGVYQSIIDPKLLFFIHQFFQWQQFNFCKFLLSLQ